MLKGFCRWKENFKSSSVCRSYGSYLVKTPTPWLMLKLLQVRKTNLLCRSLCRNPTVQARATRCNAVTLDTSHRLSKLTDLLPITQLGLTRSHSFSLRFLSSGPGGRRFKSSLPDQFFSTTSRIAGNLRTSKRTYIRVAATGCAKNSRHTVAAAKLTASTLSSHHVRL